MERKESEILVPDGKSRSLLEERENKTRDEKKEMSTDGRGGRRGKKRESE
jgi:hypothetical protein